MTEYPKFFPMDTAPMATREQPILLYYPELGVVPFCERSGDGWGHRVKRWQEGDCEVLNFVLGKPAAWMPSG
jgi:hypothetical protein